MTPANPVEALAIAKAMREQLWLYPAVEVVLLSEVEACAKLIAAFAQRLGPETSFFR